MTVNLKIFYRHMKYIINNALKLKIQAHCFTAINY